MHMYVSLGLNELYMFRCLEKNWPCNKETQMMIWACRELMSWTDMGLGCNSLTAINISRTRIYHSAQDPCKSLLLKEKYFKRNWHWIMCFGEFINWFIINHHICQITTWQYMDSYWCHVLKASIHALSKGQWIAIAVQLNLGKLSVVIKWL